MLLKRPGLIEDCIAEKGCWEPGIAKTLAKFLKDGSIFIDVGANIGYHILYLASMFPGIKCIGFEPNPDILKQFINNIKINRFKNIAVYDHAVGNREGWLIQIDTQGYEYQVLQGAADLIDKLRPVISFEAHNYSRDDKKILKLLSNYEFFRVDFWTGETIEYDNKQKKLHGDFLCIPK